MDIVAEKSFLIKKLEQTNDETLLRAIHDLIKHSQARDENYLGESIDDYNRELEEAKARVESGKFITHEDVEKESSKW
jgi:predicted transcriptional regulator